MVTMNDLLKYMVAHKGSDLYLTCGAPPSVKINGQLTPIPQHESFKPGEVKQLAFRLLNQEQIHEFETSLEMNLAIAEPAIGRFRVNIFKQRHEVGIVIRAISSTIPDATALGLPPVLTELIMEKRGLVLFVGATGSGKSSSLAALINHRNKNAAGHIITIEDPVEFVHPHQKSIVTQREVGVDTVSYDEALKNTLRQAPDVILIGEIRSRETMEHAIAFAETGHLCLSTLHANNANQALDRIINFFPEERRNQLLTDLSFNLKGIVSQRLVNTIDGKRTVAIEILLGTPLILELIKRGDILSLKEVMEKSENLGMQTFDGALYKLYMEDKISYEEAIHNADSKNNLRLRISLTDKGALDIQRHQDTEESPDKISKPQRALSLQEKISATDDSDNKGTPKSVFKPNRNVEQIEKPKDKK